MDRLPQELQPEGAITRRIVASLQGAYTAHVTNHDPLIGCDAFTLGVSLWRGSWHFIEQEFPDLARRPNGTFFLEFPDYNLYFYRDKPNGKAHRFIGGSEVQRAILRVNSQICFDFFANNAVTGKPNLVTLHTGTFPAGLTDVGIGLPVTPTDPETSWSFFDRVFFYRQPTVPDPREESGVQHKPFNELDVLEIEIFPTESEDDATGEEL
jgi:hypothetical protein